MVIACPNCARKYQIDTSRIPRGGTSFTCWSCRATVSVDAGGATTATAESRPTDDEAQQAPGVQQPPHTAESSIPLSAMRFFESLAAEASMNKQMAGQAPHVAGESPVPPAAPAPEPPLAPPEPERPARQATMIMSSQPVTPAARVADESTMRLLTGDDVLDLPNLVPVSTPEPEVGAVLEIDTPSEPKADEAVAPLSFAPVESSAAAPEPVARTRSFASAPPPVVDEPTREPEPEREPPPVVAPPRLRTAPTPIPLPVNFQASTTAPIAPEPAIPALETPPRPIRPTPPAPAITVRPPTPEPTPPVVPAEAPRPVATPVRQSPAEYAAATPHAWVAPDVEPNARRSRRPLALLALVAILIVGVSAFLLWRGPLRELISPSSVATNPPQQPGPQPSQPSQAAQQPAPSELPAQKTEPAPAPTPTAGPAASAPAGTGAFTVQVRSSPNEADARASAETLKSAGFDAYVARADLGARGVWYRVRVGRFASRDEAQKTAAKLRGSGRVSDAIVQAYDGP